MSREHERTLWFPHFVMLITTLFIAAQTGLDRDDVHTIVIVVVAMTDFRANQQRSIL